VSSRRTVAVRTFPASPACVASARHWVQDRCAQAGVDGDVGDAIRLLVSELFTNAITHTVSRHIAVRVAVEPDVVEVAVEDDDARPPRPRLAGPADTGGRGLTLVDVLAQEWGTRRTPRGKSVWFRVRRLRPEG
jgi:anti-sigma regulatory factor (Ser/Thr protein kinase)